MRLIENINSMIRFVGYLLPLIFLVFGRSFVWTILNKLSWHKQEILALIYIGMVLLAALFAAVAIYKLLRFSNNKRYQNCLEDLTIEVKIRIATLAEASQQVEQFFKDNQQWLEHDLNQLIDSYAQEVSKPDFVRFKQFVNDRSVVYFSHRVTERKQFLEILNKL